MKSATERTKLEAEYVNTTPEGELKVFENDMSKQYNPKAVEAAWNAWWEKHYYAPSSDKEAATTNTTTQSAPSTPSSDDKKSKKKKSDKQDKKQPETPTKTVEFEVPKPKKQKFVMVIPPPNVTGSLHLGHALTLSIEDALTRWHRMNQRDVLWVPGCDHAGIATQVVVEKQLMKLEGKTRHQYGREDFVAKVWEWKDKYGNRIYNQIRRLGASVDWSRAAFTMDDKLAKAVTEAFVRMFQNGVIYRGIRLTNWCSTLRTAISDVEVEQLELASKTMMKVPGHDPKKLYPFGILTMFGYPVENSNEQLVVATTRPETMLGDTAVAVHSQDARYKHLHGKFVIHPFNQRRIPIITDDILVNMEFGTGVVKVTPAHDPKDFECGKRNKLEEINIFTEDGKINENGAPFQGQMRFDCRLNIVEALKEKGLFKGETDNPMVIPVCSRSGDIIEPRLIPQWWVKCDKMAKDALDAVESGELKIIPSEHIAKWKKWHSEIRDWCISRQLWWGHRIPAYQVVIDGVKPDDKDLEKWVVARTEKEALEIAQKRFPQKAKKITLEQDPDVLDTWFSSGLFPFSTLGWPDNTEDMKNFFPTTLLETGHDILTFWVSRMVMMSQHLTGQLPFKEVYLHSMVRDKYGRKMSKSLGNVVDPLEVVDGCTLEDLYEKLVSGNLPPQEIEKAKEGQRLDFPQGIPACGTDALRFGLLAYTTQGQDINLDICRIVAYRNFCNKLWNATHLMRFSFEDLSTPLDYDTTNPKFLKSLAENGSFIDKWILSKLRKTIIEVNKGFEEYSFGAAAHSIYTFFIEILCPVYLELIKPVVKSEGNSNAKDIVRKILYTTFDIGFKLLHPMMPFVTEELWHRLPGMQNSKLSIMVQQFPTPAHIPESWDDPQSEDIISLVDQIVHEIRSQKTAYNITSTKPNIFIVAKSDDLANKAKLGAQYISTLASTSTVSVISKTEDAPAGCGVSIINKDLECHVVLAGLLDVEKELEKLKKQQSEKQTAIEKLEQSMQLPGYLSKAPPQKVDQDNERLANFKTELAVINQTIAGLQKIAA
eukprot:c20838_g1_i1.p1 GENE.c20838_g1_i1~~c20838_g1_i1.p1  ORF type:complete len:1162 (+),score=580.83 c20838_g1_i1:337-3486(+)